MRVGEAGRGSEEWQHSRRSCSCATQGGFGAISANAIKSVIGMCRLTHCLTLLYEYTIIVSKRHARISSPLSNVIPVPCPTPTGVVWWGARSAGVTLQSDAASGAPKQ